MNYLQLLKDHKVQLFISFAVLLFFYSVVFVPRDLYMMLLREDGFFEFLTAIFFMITAIIFFMLFINAGYLKTAELRSVFNTHIRRYVFLLMGLVFFFGAGEEVSWGQRIIGFQTPEILQENNAQNEFNIHNLEIFNIRDADGVRKETLGKLFTMKQLFIYSFFLFLFVLPLLEKMSTAARKLFHRFYIPVPPFWLGVLFVGNYAIYRMIRLVTDSVFDNPMRQGLTEMQEFNFSFILLLLPLVWFRFSKKKS